MNKPHPNNLKAVCFSYEFGIHFARKKSLVGFHFLLNQCSKIETLFSENAILFLNNDRILHFLIVTVKKEKMEPLLHSCP